MHPCRNTVRIQQTDAVDGSGVRGGSWKVIAAQDIQTADGTLRYKTDEVVDIVKIGKAGYGISKELYLGSFRLEQAEYPKGYAAYQPEITVDGASALEIKVEQKPDESSDGKELTIDEISPLHAFMMQKTSYTLRLIDEETSGPIEGAEFVLSVAGDGSEVASNRQKTSADGVVAFSGMKKGVAYVIHQDSAPEGYRPAADVEFAVDERGLIDSAPAQDQFVSNYIVRVEVEAVGSILRKPIAGIDLALRSSDGAVVQEWSSSSKAQSFEGLAPGDYELEGPKGAKVVTVEDKAGVQRISYPMTTTLDIVVVVGAIVLIGVLAGLTWRVRRKKA